MKYSIDVLAEMLTYTRPYGGIMEQEFINDFIMPEGAIICDDTENAIITVGDGARTLFSSHVDTVHRQDGRQKVCFDKNTQQLFKDDKYPLGADDAAGVWLMLNMIAEGIAGTYLFHVGEEKGGIGSYDMMNLRPEFLQQFQHAVAFDRRGYTDVITHQGLGRCCSDAFAKELSASLGMGYRPDDTGVFTDTAQYTDLIPECTNLSVGYHHEHTGNETQDIKHLQYMLDALCGVDWAGLPAVRDPDAFDEDSVYTNRGGFGSNSYLLSLADCESLVCHNPAIAARMLYDKGVSEFDLEDAEESMEVSEQVRNGTM